MNKSEALNEVFIYFSLKKLFYPALCCSYKFHSLGVVQRFGRIPEEDNPGDNSDSFITMPDVLPDAQPTVSKHWLQLD